MLFLGLILATAARGQTLDASQLKEPTDLGSTWLVQGGDDPAYARSDFDDSRWSRFDPHGDVSHLFLKPYPAVVWYRLHVKVSPAQTGLALRELSIERAFEVYVNGERLIVSGRVAPYRPYTSAARIVQRIPDAMVAQGNLVIALRVAIAPDEWISGDEGYSASNLTLGQEGTLKQEAWLAVLGGNMLNWLDSGLLVGLGIVALVLFSAQRQQWEYLWLFGLAMARMVRWPMDLLTLFHNVPILWKLPFGLLMIASPFLWVSVYFGFVGRKIGPKFRAYLCLAGILDAYSNMADIFPSPPGLWGLVTNLPFVTLLAIVIPVILIVDFRRGNREAGILLVPAILFSLYIYLRFAVAILLYIPGWRPFALHWLLQMDKFQVGPFSVSLNSLTGILTSISLAVILLLRATRLSRRQAMLEGELAAAQEVQQLLVPERAEAVRGYTVESVYQPAQQVGGDFFQVLPVDGDGLLLVLGDVAGKGLPAAMLVSLLVGAIRTAAEESHAPDVLLRKLNERRVGQSRGGFSTALAAYFAADGMVTLANAGHLSPYLDGREIDLAGALPLGIVSGIQYQTKQVQLLAGSRLTFYSDGVIEAQNAVGELFGFERGQNYSTRPAEEIVKAAEAFGQSDDITVVAVTRTWVGAEAMGEPLFAMQPVGHASEGSGRQSS